LVSLTTPAVVLFVQNIRNIPEIGPETHPASSDEFNILQVMDLARMPIPRRKWEAAWRVLLRLNWKTNSLR
jgi:hypothetical protein